MQVVAYYAGNDGITFISLRTFFVVAFGAELARRNLTTVNSFSTQSGTKKPSHKGRMSVCRAVEAGSLAIGRENLPPRGAPGGLGGAPPRAGQARGIAYDTRPGRRDG